LANSIILAILFSSYDCLTFKTHTHTHRTQNIDNSVGRDNYKFKCSYQNFWCVNHEKLCSKNSCKTHNRIRFSVSEI